MCINYYFNTLNKTQYDRPDPVVQHCQPYSQYPIIRSKISKNSTGATHRRGNSHSHRLTLSAGKYNLNLKTTCFYCIIFEIQHNRPIICS